MRDLHVHTPFCRHATGSPAEYAAAARRAGLAGICFSDHAPSPDGYDPANRMAMAEFPRYKAAVMGLEHGLEPEVLFGIEADYHETCVGFLEQWLPEQDFDVVLGSVHYIGEWGFDDPAQISKWADADVAGVWREYFKRVAALARTRMFDVLTHPDLPKKFGHRPPEKVARELAAPALDALAAAGMAIEINTSGLRKPAREIYPSAFILAMAEERGIPVCFGSDAHEPGQVGADFERAGRLARDTGYKETACFRKRKMTMTSI